MEGTTPKKEDFAAGILANIESLRSPLVEDLQRLMSTPIPKSVFAISFEIFSDGFTYEFPVVGYPMNRENSQTDLPGYGMAFRLLEGSMQPTYPAELEEPFLNDHEFDAWSFASKIVCEWFYNIWQQAGGQNFPVPATIAHHDDDMELNLQTGQWQETSALFD